MRLKKARVQKYRSIRESGWFDVEPCIALTDSEIDEIYSAVPDGTSVEIR